MKWVRKKMFLQCAAWQVVCREKNIGEKLKTLKRGGRPNNM